MQLLNLSLLLLVLLLEELFVLLNDLLFLLELTNANAFFVESFFKLLLLLVVKRCLTGSWECLLRVVQLGWSWLDLREYSWLGVEVLSGDKNWNVLYRWEAIELLLLWLLSGKWIEIGCL